jgi:hypothetical protein
MILSSLVLAFANSSLYAFHILHVTIVSERNEKGQEDIPFKFLNVQFLHSQYLLHIWLINLLYMYWPSNCDEVMSLVTLNT